MPGAGGLKQKTNRSGILDLIGGPMFSGKSTEVLKRLAIEGEIGFKVLYINSQKDDRSTGPFSTHNPLYVDHLQTVNIDSMSVNHLTNIDVSNYDVIGIDEAQFFEDLTIVIGWVDKLKKHVIVAGLNASYERKKFGYLLDLEPYADSYTRLTAWCKLCAGKRLRTPALFTHKMVKNGMIEESGGKNKYMSLCRECYLCENEENLKVVNDL